MIVPFSPTRDISSPIVKNLYKSQVDWEKECFNVPVLGINDATALITVPNSGGRQESFRSWLLAQKDSRGCPHLRSVERANGYTHFFVTTYAQRRTTWKWVDGLVEFVNEAFPEAELQAVFDTDDAIILQSNKPTIALQTPADTEYNQMLESARKSVKVSLEEEAISGLRGG